MSGWPDPYPAIFAELWRKGRGDAAVDAQPELPAPPPHAVGYAADDPFWARAFAGFVAKHFELGEPGAHTSDDMAATEPAMRTAFEPHVPGANLSDDAGSVVPDAKPADEPAPAAEPDAIPASEPAPAEPAQRTPPVPATGTGDVDWKLVVGKIATALEAIPKDVRRNPHDKVVEETASLVADPGKLAGNDRYMKLALQYGENLGRFAAVMPAVEPAASAYVAALESVPGVSGEGDGEVEHAAAKASPGTKTRVLRLGFHNPDGKVLIKPRHQVSSRELTSPRAEFETFTELADAIEKLAPEIEPTTWHFLRKAPEVIDSHAQGDPTSNAAVKLLTDCVGFATDFSYFHALPEYASISSGFDRVVDVIAAILRDHASIRVFPSIAQPFREGRPAPAPFPQTVLKEIPDPSLEGTLLRIRTRGYLRDGKIEAEPVIFISKGDGRFGALAKGLQRMAVAGRRLDLPFKKRKAFVARADKLLLDWVDAQDEDGESLALRFLVNHLDETEAKGSLRDAADRIVEWLQERHELRASRVSLGSRIDTLNPKEYDFQNQPGSGQPADTVLHVKKRVFKDAGGQTVQRGLVVTS